MRLRPCLAAGAKRLVPQEWRKWPLFDKIFTLTGVPVITVQLRYNGWVTELQDPAKLRDLTKASFQQLYTHTMPHLLQANAAGKSVCKEQTEYHVSHVCLNTFVCLCRVPKEWTTCYTVQTLTSPVSLIWP